MKLSLFSRISSAFRTSPEKIQYNEQTIPQAQSSGYSNIAPLTEDTVSISQPKKELKTGWVKFPSKENDPEHYEENLKNLKAIFADIKGIEYSKEYNELNTATFSNDFHIYLDRGKPKVIIKTWRGRAESIQKEFDSSAVHPMYYDKIMELIDAQGLDFDKNLSDRLLEAKYKKVKLNSIIEDIGPDIKAKNYSNILKYFGIERQNGIGGYTLSSYKNPDLCTFEELGIDEEEMLKDVVEIKGDADFSKSSICDLKNIKKIGGKLTLNHKFISLGDLQSVGGNFSLGLSSVSDLGELTTIGGNASFSNKLTSLGKLKNIGGNADFAYCKFNDLAELETIGGDASFGASQITDLKKLQRIGGDASFKCSRVKNLGQLETIGKDAIFDDSEIVELDNLKTVGGNASFRRCKVKKLGQLSEIGGELWSGNLPETMFDGIEYRRPKKPYEL